MSRRMNVENVRTHILEAAKVGDKKGKDKAAAVSVDLHVFNETGVTVPISFEQLNSRLLLHFMHVYV